MPTSNFTQNQHFISQAEQRLNAANPEAAVRRRRIYSFRLQDRERLLVQLEHPNGIAIRNNLAFTDLFSFDVFGTARTNLEASFARFERSIAYHSGRLIERLRARDQSDLKTDLLEVFCSKFLNFFRNPHSVKKALASLGTVLDEHPAGPAERSIYASALSGNRPQQAAVCRRFGLSEQEYERWLYALSVLLGRRDDAEPSPLEMIAKRLFESNNVQVVICHFTGAETCLLSDRGFVVSAEEPGRLGLDFNLCSQAFVTFLITDVRSQMPPWIAPERVAEFVPAATAALHGHVTVHPVIENNMAYLKAYNGRVVYQCAERVFSAKSTAPTL
jgi:hypothetical protein